MAETFPGLLRDRAAREPDRVAMRVGGEALTFGAWHDRAARIAAGLAVRRGDRVGLLFDEHDWLDFAAAYAGVQAAGAVAMPISARTPGPEITRLLTEFGAAGLIHGTGLDARGWAIEDVITDRPGGVDVRPGDLAQILFTSGTTGRPKGVSATHVNLTYGYHPRMRRRPLAHSKLFLHAFPLGTNAAQTMLFNALTAEPAALVLPRFDAAEFCALIEENRVGTAFLVPAMAIDLVASGALDRYDLSSVLLLGSTAAALPPEIAKTLATAFENADIVNYYSSTEAAPAQTVMIFDPDRPAAVGQPADGDLRITDAAGHPLPTGETGEVWLRSPTTARTYFGDASATSAVFRDGWIRMGDLGHLDDEGYLYLVDRESDVIKSGAFKISTLRIEAELYAHPDVREAAVLGLSHPVLGSVPAAAVVLRRPVDDLRAFAATRLARHEIPARWLILDALPRNDAGKVLKRTLRDLFDAPSESAAPASDAEKRLAGLWARALGRDVPAGADFFAAGGDSFAAARFAALAAEEFGVEVPVSFVFDFPDLAAQARQLADRRPAARVEVDVSDGVPLSSLQEYFLRWLGETAEPRAVSAVAVAIRITDLLDVPALRRALDDVVARHDALRTVFPGGQAEVLDRCEPDFDEVFADDPVRQACAELERPFDLERGPLVRALVIEEGPEEFVLVLGVHHLVFDGHSMGVLLRELGECYAGQGHRLPPAGRAADVSAWARTRWPEAREFWQHALDGAPATLSGAPRSAEIAAFEGHSVPFEIPSELVERLRAKVAEQRATVYMGLLTVWAKAMAEWAGSDEVVVMSPLPGRTKPEFDTVVGCLVQSLLLRIDVADDPPFEELLPRVRQVVLDATEHQYYPYEEFSRRIPQPAWLRFERWGGPVHFPGLESGPVELPRELMFSWPMPGPDLSVPELALTEHPDGRITGWLVHNRLTYEPPAIDRLAELVLAQLREVR
ncbi:AMP-binding protein [Amycolatopsis sp. NPDC021455]|uniref:class I adenylate-forming enzyme family protein n=1 Tax=Amycolatopsis sp. NPDC021455 TaxID=3154901 RepID=UPI0033F7F65E